MACNTYLEELLRGRPDHPWDDGPIRTDVVPAGFLRPFSDGAGGSVRPTRSLRTGIFLPPKVPCVAPALRGFDAVVVKPAPPFSTRTTRRYPFGDFDESMESGSLEAIHIGCAELDLLIDKLKLAKAELKRLGTINAALESYLDRYDTFFRFSYSVETCKNVIDEGLKNLGAVNGIIVSKGGSVIALPSLTISPSSTDDTLDRVKGIVTAGAVIVGLGAIIYLVGPAIRTVSSRAVGGLSRRRRRNRRR